MVVGLSTEDLSREDLAGEDLGGEDLGHVLRQVALGDPAALPLLAGQVRADLVAYATRRLRDRSLAEEVVQEVLLAVWLTADSYDPGRGSPHAWLMTMAHHRCVDRMRQDGRRRAREVRLGARYLEPVDRDAVADEALVRVAARRLHEAVRSLTDLQREAVEHVYLRDRPVAEVASLLGLPVPTLKSRLRDARLSLRRRLGTNPITS
jgi:RNA polymerase sigma-70 factor (ECF subfamily)